MAVLIDTRTGPVVLADGAGDQPIRNEKTGALVVQDAHGRYTESVLRNKVFSACTTAAATIGALTTTGVTYHLYNPINSGVNASVLVASYGATSTTFVVGSTFFAVNVQTTAPTATTALTIRSNLLSNTAAPSAVQVFSAATLANTPVAVRPFFSVPATTSGTSVLVKDDVAGEMVVPPGSVLSIQASVAACAIGHLGMSWEEIPV